MSKFPDVQMKDKDGVPLDSMGFRGDAVAARYARLTLSGSIGTSRYVSDPTNRNNIHQPRAPSNKSGKMLRTLEGEKPTQGMLPRNSITNQNRASIDDTRQPTIVVLFRVQCPVCDEIMSRGRVFARNRAGIEKTRSSSCASREIGSFYFQLDSCEFIGIWTARNTAQK
eukprot:gene18974-biopygen714